MSQQNIIYVSILLLIFIAISGIVAAIGMEIQRRRSLSSRLHSKRIVDRSDQADDSNDHYEYSVRERPLINSDTLTSLLSDSNRTKLSSDLIKAGIFSPTAPAVYVSCIFLSVIACAVIGFILVRLYLFTLPVYMQLSILGVSAYLGYFLPDAYLRSKLANTKQEYLSVFPDFLDLLVVCVDAGLSLNASLDRVTTEFYERSQPLATNFSILLQEIRVGREMADALDNLSDRVDVDEVRSFCTLIKQSLELGSDVTEALRVYSEEMRVKRMFRAEEEANKLPVKMLIPLGLFIFPVILIVILAPIVVRVANMGK